MDRVAAVLEQIAELSASEVEQVRQRMKALSSIAGNGVASDGEDTAFARTVLDTIIDVLSSLGVEFGNATMLQRSRQYQTFKTKTPGLQKWLRQCESRVEQRAVLRKGVELLYRDLLQMGLPISSRYLMQHIDRIPSIVTQHYPCWVEAGLLRMILRVPNTGANNVV